MRQSCYWRWISSKRCQSNLRIHSAIGALLIHSYIDNGMTKFMINNRTDAWKTDVNLLNLHNAGEEANWDYVEQYRVEDLTRTARFQIQPLKIRHAAFC